MNPDKSIVEFLCRDENLSLAIEVAEAIDAVDENIERRFLDLMFASLSEKFNASSLGRDWKLEKDVEQTSRTRYARIYVSPRQNEASHRLSYAIVVCREPPGFYLYYGLEWGGNSGEQPASFPTNESIALVKFLDQREFKRSRWTLGWKTVASFMDRKELLLGLHQRGAKEFAPLTVNDFWVFVENTVNMVADVNASLRNPIEGSF